MRASIFQNKENPDYGWKKPFAALLAIMILGGVAGMCKKEERVYVFGWTCVKTGEKYTY